MRRTHSLAGAIGLGLCLLATAPMPVLAEESADAASARELDHVTVTGRRRSLVGEAVSASEGTIGQADIADRPLLRTGDLLELVPGLVATQHSGSGKANQYFLRGFNLDHGTDFATFVDGMPVNMRTHGHGQGYTDLNFLIPETVESLDYRKGPYYADVGDFSAAGSARFDIADRVDAGAVELTLGSSASHARWWSIPHPPAGGDLLYAVEAQAYDGPWTDIDENVRKGSALLRYSADRAGGRAHVMLMGYSQFVELARPDPAARGVARPDLRTGVDRSHRRWRVLALQPLRRLGGPGVRRRFPRRCVRDSSSPRPVVELHLFPRRSGQRRPVPAGRRAQRVRLQPVAAVGARPQHAGASAARAGSTTSAGSALLRTRDRALRRHRARRRGARGQPGAVRGERVPDQ